jgi:U3 small nucleolar RNA-associated protein 10
MAEENRFKILSDANQIAYKILMSYSNALQRLHEQDGQVFDSYEVIMQSVLKELQIVGKSRAKNSDPYLLDVENQAYKVLDALKDTMNPVHFMDGLIRSLSYKNSSDQMKRKAFLLLSRVVTKDLSDLDATDPAFHQCIHDGIGAIVSSIKDTNKQSEMCRQSALEALSSFAERFSAYHHDVFLQVIPATVELVSDQEVPAVRGMALICIASFIRNMKNAVIPMLPRIIQAILDGSKAGVTMGKDNVDTVSILDISSSLSALQALSENLASFLAPKLMDILNLLLNVNVVDGYGQKSKEGTGVKALGELCRRLLAASIPARLLIGPLRDVIFGIYDNLGESQCSLVQAFIMLADSISHMDSTSIATYNTSIFSMILKGLDTRRVMKKSTNTLQQVYRIESEAIRCMLELVLKLNESKFKPIFFRLVEWATASPAGAKQASVARRTTFFNVINVLTENLKSVFTGYFSSFVNLILDALKETTGNQAERLTLQVVTMRSLTRCFMYDTTAFLNEGMFDKLLHPLIDILVQNTSIHALSSNPEEMMSKHGLAPDPVFDDMIICPDWVKSSLDIYSSTLIVCLSQMTNASGMNDGEARWRPLHHAVLMATRASSADARCAALETTMSICNLLQEEYLPLLPEALPFLSELLEDEDSRVEKRTVEVLKEMEKISGEDLKQYLAT